MLIATSLNICPRYFDHAELIRRLARAGYDGIDLNLWDHHPRVDWRDDAAAAAFLDPLRAAAAEADLHWVQAHGPFFNLFAQREPDVTAAALCPAALRACARAGAPWMVIHPGTFAGPFDRAHRRALIDGHVRFIRDLLPLCERTGVGLALENLSESGAHALGFARRFGSVVEDLCDVVDAVNHPLVGICWDTGHARMNQWRDQRAALAALGPRLRCLHIQDNDGRTDHHALPLVLGHHGVDWDSVAAGLRDADYRGAWTYEFHNAFLAVPEPLFDDVLALSVQVARVLTATVARPAAAGAPAAAPAPAR